MIIDILTLIAFSYLFINAEPLILLKRWFGFKEEKYDELSNIMKFFHRLIYCIFCSCFWIGIIYTAILGYNILYCIQISAISSFLSAKIDNHFK